MTTHTKFWYLDNFDFFSGLTMDQRRFVHSNTKMTHLLKDESVYFEGSPATSIYFLKEGEMRISKYNESGEEFLINIISPGSIFGMSSLTGGPCRTETAVATKPSLICILDNEKMKDLLKVNAELNLKFCALMETRMTNMQQRLENLTFKKGEDRIIDFIKSKAITSGVRENGHILIKSSLTQDSIAKLSSTSRQMVSEVFSDLKKKGIIDYNRKEIKILNPDAIIS
jgi:CRP-like cAMP-binding protein